MTPVLFYAGSFALGSIPTGYWIGRLKGVDIRREGSGNVGATNVFRSVGAGAGAATLAIDMLKGFLPVWLALRYMGGETGPVLCGLAAVAGHTFSPFLNFKGGKGVATSGGVFAALLPVPTALALLAFAVGFGTTRRVSVGSLLSAALLPAAAFESAGPSPRAWLALAIGVVIVLKHLSNIRRLLKGEEPTLKAKGKETDGTP